MQSRGRVLRRLGLAMCVCAALMAVNVAPARAQNAQWGASYFPNVPLTTQDGRTVRFYDDLIKGKIVAVNLIYTTCKYACPLETARLAQVQRLLGDRMGKDVFFYSITIDPAYDTPAVLKEYAAKFDAGPGWLFLTGTQEDIDLISRKTGLYSEPNPSNPDGHTPHLLVGSEVTGQWIRNSGVDDPRFLATTIGTWLNSWRTATAPTRSYADAPKLDFAAGEYVFQKHCAACHTVGDGDRIGPDLAGVTARRDGTWLTRFISEPEAMRASGDPTAKALAAKYQPAIMPRLGVEQADVAQLLQYIDTKTVAAHPAAADKSRSATAAPAADLSAVMDPYVRIQQALNLGKLDGIRERAREVAAQAKALGPDAEAIRLAATAIDRPLEIAAVRTAFGTLGDALIAYAKERHAPFGAGVKVAYCPMVRKYWLQRGETIQNPYYGQQMSDCGRFAADLPSVGQPATSGTTTRSQQGQQGRSQAPADKPAR
ncbi:MAG TPA: SCO family protein [Vicinamibacterales bacterium]|nr:SCO family protein [Vicinamibacterales bacterium]